MNRGRIQAQGKGCEKSQAWTQPDVPTKRDGRQKALWLKQSLNRREKSEREACFDKLNSFIMQAPSLGYDTCNRSYTSQPPIEDVRVDVEIIKGRAFRDDD